MPLPKPNEGESRKDYLDRCMADSAMNREYPDSVQRYAVCNSQWDRKDKKSSASSGVMSLIQNTAWVILPEMLETIHGIVSAHLSGEFLLKEDEIQERIRERASRHMQVVSGHQLEGTRTVMVRDGIAVIGMVGVLSKRMNMFTEFSGGASTELLARDFQIARDAKNIEGILFDADTPGGTVDGTKAFADLIFESRGAKPIVTFGNGLIASGGIWIGSAADKIVIEETAQAGSIGVIMMHSENSRAAENFGVKRTVITAGKYKGMGNSVETLSSEARDYIQAHLDYTYGLFTDAVAKHRGVDSKVVRERMAEGRIFIGQQAVDVGLVDQVGSFDVAFKLARDLRGSSHGTRAKPKQETGGKTMDLNTLKTQHPEVYEAARKEIQAEMSVKFDAEKTQLRTEISTLRTEKAEMNKKLATQEKEEAIRVETERTALVNLVWTEKLTASSIPERLHAKVRKQVDPDDFTSETGALKVEDFKKAVEAEIGDWEGRAPKNQVLGGIGATGKEPDATVTAVQTEKSDDAAVDDMLALAGDKK